ncbi:MAG: hypothetical protein U9N08_08175 [Candidatus Caldatribacteriota bacterium]|nr:hypothetical protein [Candidatus Caldatribacteriota bacterium]
MFKKFKTYLQEKEGGAIAGKLEISDLSVEEAKKFAEKEFKKQNLDLSEEIPNFESNFLHARKLAKLGHTKRKDMPVITSRDVKLFQQRLKDGYIDIHKPFSKVKVTDNPNDPFPEGLSGTKAKQWLQNGLKKFDGSETDDKIKITEKKIKVSDLKPIQEQIYFDKVIKKRAKENTQNSVNFIKSSFFIVSSDNYIIDGHHRFLSGCLTNPDLKINAVVIDLPINTLLPMVLSYSDAIGNSRNN